MDLNLTFAQEELPQPVKEALLHKPNDIGNPSEERPQPVIEALHKPNDIGTPSEERPQPVIEALHKPSDIGTPTDSLEVGQLFIAKDSTQVAKLVESIRDKSRRFRCALSGSLMMSPMLAPDGDFYEQSLLREHPSLPREYVLPNPKLKAEITEFSKRSLMELAVHLKSNDLSDDFIELTAECLSVLDIEDEMVCRVLGALEEESMQRLAVKLRDFIQLEHFVSLIYHTADQLPSQALCLVRLLMLEPTSEAAFEVAFACLNEILSKVALSEQFIDLAEEVSGRLSCSQISQMNRALQAQPKEGELELRLRLKGMSLQLRKEASSSQETSDLKQRLSTALEVVSRKSLSVAEACETVRQLFYAELQSLNLEAAAQHLLSRLKTEIRVLQDGLDEAQSASKRTRQALEEESQRSEAAQQALLTLRAEHSTLTSELSETTHLLQAAQAELHHLKTFPAKLHEQTLPIFIFSYNQPNKELHLTNLCTGVESCHSVQINQFCCWTELPEGSLLLTGGGIPEAVREVVEIDVKTFAVSPQTPMHSARNRHAAVYYLEHVYVLGGYVSSSNFLADCERYSCASKLWETLPALPSPCYAMSPVVIENCLYALGGNAGCETDLDSIHMLRLDRLTWQLLELRLPQSGCYIPCFKVRDSQVYLLINKTLYSFTPCKVTPLKTLAEDVQSFFGASYYCRGTLYCSDYRGAARALEIGDLTSCL
jgi:hypothetical protein